MRPSRPARRLTTLWLAACACCALLVGGALWGLIGAILAIPTAAILAVFVEEFASHGQPTEAD